MQLTIHLVLCSLLVAFIFSSTLSIVAATDPVRPWFEDQFQEILDPIQLTKGTSISDSDSGNNQKGGLNLWEENVPLWLDGSFVANGPGQFTSSNRNVTSLLDGLGYLSKFNIENGQIFYQSEYIHSKMFETTRKNDNFCKSSYLGEVNPPFKKVGEHDCPPDNTNVNVWNIPNNDDDPNDKFYSFTDSTFTNSFNPTTLNTVDQEESFRKVDDHSTSRSIDTEMSRLSCAHPHIDTRNGDLINFVITSKSPKDNILDIFRMNGDEKRHVIGQVKLDGMKYMHSFAMTENYVLIFAFPVNIKLSDILTKKPILSSFEWTGDTEGTKIYIFDLPPPSVTFSDKKDIPGPIAILETDPFFSFHHVTAYEEEKNIHVDIITYDNLDILEQPITFGPLDVMLDSQKRNQIQIDSKYKRFTISTPNKTNKGKDSDDDFHVQNITEISPVNKEDNNRVVSVDFPIVSPNVYSMKNCFVYLVSYGTKTIDWDSVGISKINLCSMTDTNTKEKQDSKTTSISSYDAEIKAWVQDGWLPSEPTFVPNPNGVKEDDGVLLSQVYDTKNEKTFLAIIDAKEMKLLSAIYAPIRVPYRFHGQYFEGKH